MNDNADEEQWNRRQAQAAPKAESVHSAEELVSKIREEINIHDADGNVCGVYDYRLTDADLDAEKE